MKDQLTIICIITAACLGVYASNVGAAYPLKVSRVVDGDTVVGDIDLGFGVHLVEERVRFSDLDAWEISTQRGGVTAKEIERGKVAKSDLESVVRYGALTLEPVSRKRDTYGRILGKVYSGGASVSEWMKARGHQR